MAQLKDLIVNGSSRFIGPVAAGADPTQDMELATKHFVENSLQVQSSINNILNDTDKNIELIISVANNTSQPISIPAASDTTAGTINIGTQTIAGAKTFTSPISYINNIGTLTGDNTLATLKYVNDAFAVNDAMVFKGVLANSTDFTTASNQTFSAGWTYKATNNFSFTDANSLVHNVENGDLIIAIRDKDDPLDSTKQYWTVVQTNADGSVVAYDSANFNYGNNEVAVFNGSSKVIKSSGMIVDPQPISSNDNTISYVNIKNAYITSGQQITGNPVPFLGIKATAEGFNVAASGNYSHAEGQGTIANSLSQHVFGEYNIADNTGNSNTRGNYVEIVGNGSNNSPSNARTLDWYGNETLYGNLTLNNNSPRLIFQRGTLNDSSIDWAIINDYSGNSNDNGILAFAKKQENSDFSPLITFDSSGNGTFSGGLSATTGTFSEPITISRTTESSSSIDFDSSKWAIRLMVNNQRTFLLQQQVIGTTDEEGKTVITLGNDTPSQSAENSYGIIRLYGKGSVYTALDTTLTNNNDNNYTMHLPNYQGSGYLTHTQSASAVGSSIKPVYVAENGRILASSGTVGSINKPIYLNAGTITACADSMRIVYYGESSTGASTAKKVVIANGFSLETGSVIFVKFTNTNSAAVDSLTLNVNSTGEKDIKYVNDSGTVSNLSAPGALKANIIYQFIYIEYDDNNKYWVLMNPTYTGLYT